MTMYSPDMHSQFATFMRSTETPPVGEWFCAQKTGRQEMQGSIFGRTGRPNRSEFSVFFSETHVNMS